MEYIAKALGTIGVWGGVAGMIHVLAEHTNILQSPMGIFTPIVAVIAASLSTGMIWQKYH